MNRYTLTLQLGDVQPFTVLERQITDTQASIIREVLDTPSLTYGEAFDFLIERRQLHRLWERTTAITESEQRLLDGNR